MTFIAFLLIAALYTQGCMEKHISDQIVSEKHLSNHSPNPHSAETKSPEEKTSLHLAAKRGCVKTITGLLHKHSSDINTKDENELAPLHWAAIMGHSEAVSILVSRGAAIDIKDSEKETPLIKAVIWNRGKTASVLISHGADIHICDASGKTLLHKAPSAEIINLLVKAAGIDPNVRDSRGAAPLHYAESAEVAEALIKHGALVNTLDKGKLTPLHNAARFGLLPVVKVLLKCGADTEAVDRYGRGVTSWPRKFGFTDVLNEIENWGIKRGGN